MRVSFVGGTDSAFDRLVLAKFAGGLDPPRVVSGYSRMVRGYQHCQSEV